jgi:heme-degrading monooxygenase HmoA
MFARVSRYSGSTAGLRKGFESVSAELEKVEGFVQAFFLADDQHSRAMSITLWESKAALDASAERAHRMRTQASEPADATIDAVENYEVTLTVKPPAQVG